MQEESLEIAIQITDENLEFFFWPAVHAKAFENDFNVDFFVVKEILQEIMFELWVLQYWIAQTKNVSNYYQFNSRMQTALFHINMYIFDIWWRLSWSRSGRKKHNGKSEVNECHDLGAMYEENNDKG